MWVHAVSATTPPHTAPLAAAPASTTGEHPRPWSLSSQQADHHNEAPGQQSPGQWSPRELDDVREPHHPTGLGCVQQHHAGHGGGRHGQSPDRSPIPWRRGTQHAGDAGGYSQHLASVGHGEDAHHGSPHSVGRLHGDVTSQLGEDQTITHGTEEVGVTPTEEEDIYSDAEKEGRQISEKMSRTTDEPPEIAEKMSRTTDEPPEITEKQSLTADEPSPIAEETRGADEQSTATAMIDPGAQGPTGLATGEGMNLKGAVSRYSVIFCAFFCASKNSGCSRKCRGHRSESLAVRAAWQPGHQRWLLIADMTVPRREPTTSRAMSCTVSLVDGDRQHFCFQATRPEQGDIPFCKVQD